MRFGEPKWCCVTIDEPCVPKRGKWGCVRWFARQCEKHRMKLAWSKRHDCFMVFSQKGRGKWFCQEIYRRGLTGITIPLTAMAFWSLIFLFNRGARWSNKRVFQLREQVERDMKAKQIAEERDHIDQVGREELRRIQLDYGFASPNVMPLPRRVGRYRRPYQGPGKRGRILLPHEAN